MTAIAHTASAKPQASVVISKAVARAADRLGIPKSLLARVLGVSPPTITRLYSGAYLLDQNRKEWDFALLFVRVFRSLDSIVGDESTARKWLQSENRGLNAKPIDLIRNTEGLVRVVQYHENRGRQRRARLAGDAAGRQQTLAACQRSGS